MLTNGKNNLLIDTSTRGLWNRLQKCLDQSGIRHIDYLIFTHAHFDHAGNACKIKEKYGAAVIVQKNEANCSLFIPSHGSANSRLLVQKDYEKRVGKNDK